MALSGSAAALMIIWWGDGKGMVMEMVAGWQNRRMSNNNVIKNYCHFVGNFGRCTNKNPQIASNAHGELHWRTWPLTKRSRLLAFFLLRFLLVVGEWIVTLYFNLNCMADFYFCGQAARRPNCFALPLQKKRSAQIFKNMCTNNVFDKYFVELLMLFFRSIPPAIHGVSHSWLYKHIIIVCPYIFFFVF